MNYFIRLEHRAEKEYEKLDKSTQIKILKAFDTLAEDPFCGKKLGGELEGSYSIRVWPYRILYLMFPKQKTILILRIAHRKDVYR
jgi:mRNA interferase RelE/StbE